jgi:hypothetical protein
VAAAWCVGGGAGKEGTACLPFFRFRVGGRGPACGTASTKAIDWASDEAAGFFGWSGGDGPGKFVWLAQGGLVVGPQGISAARESKRSENGLKCPFISKTRNTHKPKISSHHFYFTYFYSIRDFFSFFLVNGRYKYKSIAVKGQNSLVSVILH